jgi:hypothetical protein
MRGFKENRTTVPNNYLDEPLMRHSCPSDRDYVRVRLKLK